MSKQSAYQRIFGVGPLGTAISIGLLFLAMVVARSTPGGWLAIPEFWRLVALNAGGVGAVAIIWWSLKSLKSLKPEERGRKLCTRGPFRYVRHPLYASFLSWFNFGLALYLGHLAFLAWAVLLHPVWHLLIAREERAFEEQFGQAWRQYAAGRGRFLPRPGSSG